ncbi:type I restriction endonuclease subunit R [Clostridium omnivorum]|uniref:Type I restriction enzyme endonuclease subunit n=1 Tax=Clostridium omnivorum TaxID=1604902 RepID=A0ABQ5N7F8_9CLOT|nr:HsdR family type I site-specific deoxyribonuclease [Clostridium sp. E14]GLC31167.1 restriction endonuclease [Clostridium sp. E14]
MNVGEIERITQERVVKLFIDKLGYSYLGNWEERKNSNVEEEYLKKHLKNAGYSPVLITKAINEFVNNASNQQLSLYDLNKEVYSALRYGVKVRENPGEAPKTVMLINWKEVWKNDFYIAEEVTVEGSHSKRPDIVLYVNGIALGVLELKRSTVSVSEGIRQNIDNQKENFIRQFFATMGLIMAGNDSEGIAYGVIETKEKYYLSWKEDKDAEDKISKHIRTLCDTVDYKLDKNIISICEQNRFLEILYDFIVFDRGIKKACRPNQYFGVKAAQERLKSREGGIIWHTQGSGKSLTMVWLAKWIKENKKDSRILVITDREELDEQIEKVFMGVGESIYRTKSGRDLINKLNEATPVMICSLVHKFGRRGGELTDKDYESYIDEIKDSLPKDFRAKGDVYVFVDECHRTQSGKLHKAMKAILPNSVFIGFTGTPLIQKDKQSSIEIFGTYIHTYKFDEAVKDKVVLDLRYEARDVDQNIVSQEKIDQWFEIKTKGLTDVAKAQLKQRWGTMQKIFSSKSRLSKIASDIYFDISTKDRLQNGRGNAMLVAGSIYEACKYYELFQDMGLKKCAIITSYNPNISDIKGESVDTDSETEKLEKYEIYQKMLGGKDSATFEKEVKDKFINEPAQMKLLIVVDKLLTGFDAPSATYLYIDKSMRDHGLFQAICRVNRLDSEDKEYGYIIDYKDLFKKLEKAVEDYTSEAFDAYDKDDVKGLLKDRLKEAKEHLEELLEGLRALCEPIAPPKGTLECQRYFCGINAEDLEELKNNEPKRVALYKLTASLIRAYAEIAPEITDEAVGYTSVQAVAIKKEVESYIKLRDEIKHASGDYIDLKKYEPDMRHLIDTYISAEESRRVSALEDMSLIEVIVNRGVDFVDELPEGIKKNKEAAAETIENNVRRKIIEKTETNPKYFEKMSQLLKELVELRKRAAVSYEEYLKQIVELTKKVHKQENDTNYPEDIRKSKALMALYDNLDHNEELAKKIHNSIITDGQDGWRGDPSKSRRIRGIIYSYIGEDGDRLEKIFKIAENQGEY